MRTRVNTRRGSRGENSSLDRSTDRGEERLEIQRANSDHSDRTCSCGETNLMTEVVCDTCGDTAEGYFLEN
jgi:hypothetical protein